MTDVNIFIDMDGVLAEYHPRVLELMYDKGFFLSRPPVEDVIELVEELIKKYPNTYILSSVIDSKYSIPEKNEWLDTYLPSIKKENRLYVPIKTHKSDYVKDKVDLNDKINVLLDDFTHNLVNWDVPKAVPIKLLNGINANQGVWASLKGRTVCKDRPVEENLKYIENQIQKERETVHE